MVVGRLVSHQDLGEQGCHVATGQEAAATLAVPIEDGVATITVPLAELYADVPDEVADETDDQADEEANENASA